MNNIALLCGRETVQEAEAFRKMLANPDNYVIATLCNINGTKEMGSFVIPCKVAEMLTKVDE